jgi:hypothetical protein
LQPPTKWPLLYSKAAAPDMIDELITSSHATVG